VHADSASTEADNADRAEQTRFIVNSEGEVVVVGVDVDVDVDVELQRIAEPHEQH
jgi:hypothetical protein